MIKLVSLFTIKYPSTLVFGHQVSDPKGIPFVTSKGTNNGVAGRVRPNSSAELYPAGSITVPLKGTVMRAHLQPESFYCAHQIAVLLPPDKMTLNQRLYYVKTLRLNKYRYNYGRQADRTLRDILVPDLHEIPEWVSKAEVSLFDKADTPAQPMEMPTLDSSMWRAFKMSALFNIRKGKRLTKATMVPGQVPFIGAIDSNNGVTAFVGQAALHPGNTVTVNYNGNGVAEAFYQPVPYRCSDDVNVLYPLFELNAARALFVAAVIRQEKYRFNYGRKWHSERMEQSTIKLPVDTNEQPDWDFMERYIMSLPFSSQIQEAVGSNLQLHVAQQRGVAHEEMES